MSEQRLMVNSVRIIAYKIYNSAMQPIHIVDVFDLFIR